MRSITLGLLLLASTALHAQQYGSVTQADLSSLRDVRIGSRCEEMKAQIIQLRKEFGYTRWDGDCGTVLGVDSGKFSKVFFSKELRDASEEHLGLHFTATGYLWKIDHWTNWEPPGKAASMRIYPSWSTVLETLMQRFGRPSIVEDFMRDPIVIENGKRNGSTKLHFKGAWSSQMPNPKTTINTHVPLKRCPDSDAKQWVQCQAHLLDATIASWQRHQDSLPGIVTIATVTGEKDKASYLSIEMMDSQYIGPAQEAEKKVRRERDALDRKRLHEDHMRRIPKF